MLSAETGVGSYPVEAVRAMAEIAQAAEESPEILGRARERPGPDARGDRDACRDGAGGRAQRGGAGRTDGDRRGARAPQGS